MKRKAFLAGLFVLAFGVTYAGLETATYVSQLNAANPTGTDHYSTADDHIRLLKSTLLSSFPNISGAMTSSHTELNILDGATLSTAELNIMDGVTATTSEINLLDGVTATTAELNLVDGLTSSLSGLTSTAAELNKLDGATVTTAEINLLSGRTGTIWTSANDGVASTLDADLLDGISSSAFYQPGSNTVWHNNNDGSGSGLDADLVDGYNVSEGTGANTIAARNASGYLFAGYFNQSSSSEGGTIDNIITTQGDGYFRKATPSHVRSQLGLTNITGKSGVTKTLSSSAPSGGADGDIWYRY